MSFVSAAQSTVIAIVWLRVMRFLAFPKFSRATSVIGYELLKKQFCGATKRAIGTLRIGIVFFVRYIFADHRRQRDGSLTAASEESPNSFEGYVFRVVKHSSDGNARSGQRAF